MLQTHALSQDFQIREQRICRGIAFLGVATEATQQDALQAWNGRFHLRQVIIIDHRITGMHTRRKLIVEGVSGQETPDGQLGQHQSQ